MDPIPVTDPNVLARFSQAAAPPPAAETPQPVSDPGVLARFNAQGYTPVSSGGGVTIGVRSGTAAPDDNAPLKAAAAQRGLPAQAGSSFSGSLDRGLGDIGSTVLDPWLSLGANVAGYPGQHTPIKDLGEWFANGGSSQPTAVSPEVQPNDIPNRLASAAGNFTGENIPAIIGMNKLATSGVRAAESAAPTLYNAGKKTVNAVLDYIAQHPVGVNAGELLGSAEAGGVGEAGKEDAAALGFGPAGQKTAESLGQILGPGIMDYAPGAIVARAAGPIYKGARYVAENAGKELGGIVPENMRPDWLTNLANEGNVRRTAQANSQVGKQLGDVLAQPETRANLDQTQQLQQQIPGFNPGTARASGDQNLINTQRAFDTEATGPDLRTRQTNYDTSAQAIRGKLDNTVPQPEGRAPAADVVGKAVQQRVGGAQKAVQGQIDDTQRQLGKVSASLPEVDRSAVGNTLRDTRADLQANADKEVGRLKQGIGDPNTPIVTGHDKDGNEITMPLKAVMDRQTAINQELRLYRSASMRSVADVKAMQKLVEEKQSLDSAIENTDESMVPGLKAFRDYYRDQYVPRFGEGASRDVGRYDQFGYDKQRVAAEDVPGKWFAPNNISEAQQFNKLYGNNPEARQAITDYALDDLRQKAVDPNTGLIREGAVNRWLNQNSRVLNELPFVRDAVPKQTDDLYQRLGQLATRQKQIADTKLAGQLGRNPDQMIDAGIKDWQTMRSLKRSVAGDENAEAALRRAVWDRVVKSAGPDTLIDADKLQAFIDGNRRSLQEVLTPEHLQNIETVIQAARVQGRAPRPVGTVETPLSAPEKLGKAAGVSIPSMIASALAVARGRSSIAYEGPMQAIRFMSRQKQNAYKDAWNAALSDPNIAQTMADSFRAGKPTNMHLRRLGAYLLTAGVVQPSEVGKDGQQ